RGGGQAGRRGVRGRHDAAVVGGGDLGLERIAEPVDEAVVAAERGVVGEGVAGDEGRLVPVDAVAGHRPDAGGGVGATVGGGDEGEVRARGAGRVVVVDRGGQGQPDVEVLGI